MPHRIKIATIRSRHKGEWFDPDSVRFFRSRFAVDGYRGPGGTFFVSSEQFVSSQGEADRRRFSVREQTADGSIETVGDFQAYATQGAASAEARRLAQ